MRFFCLILLFPLTCFAQNTGIDFYINDFSGIKSNGSIPEVFIKSGYEKYQVQIENLDNEIDKTQDEFYLNTNYVVHELLLSGDILYGDPLSNYVADVATELLMEDKELRDSLQFFVLNSNAVNAFSTNQGLIFISIGLLSKIQNEAQLAFVLAHEVEHFTKKHVLKGYLKKIELDKSSGLNKDKRLIESSKFSKENEIDADYYGALRVLNSRYATEELLKALYLLKNAGKPFHSYVVPKSFFEVDGFEIYDDFFEKTEYKEEEKTLDELENEDPYATHPDIKTRIKKVKEEVQFDYDVNDSLLFIVKSQEEFEKIIDIARFQFSQNLIHNRIYFEGIYSLYYLLKKYPENYFLNKLFVQSLKGIIDHRANKSTSELYEYQNFVYGNVYRVSHFLKEISLDGLYAMTLKHAYYNYERFGNDHFFYKVANKIALKWKNYSGFVYNLKPYSLSSYEDSIKKEYDTTMVKSMEGYLDSLIEPNQFFIYGFKEVKDASFISITDSNLVDKNILDDYNSVLVVNPIVKKYSLKKEGQLKFTDALTDEYNQIIENHFQSLGKSYSLLSMNKLNSDRVEEYNNIVILQKFFDELSYNRGNGIEAELVYYDDVIEILKNYKAEKLMYSITLSVEQKERWSKVFFSLTVAGIPFFIADMFTSESNSLMLNIVLNPQKDEGELVDVRYFKRSSNEGLFRIHSYDIIKMIDL